MKNCLYCLSKNLRKRGSYQTKTGKVPRFECKACGKLQSHRTFSDNYRMRKQRLATSIKNMYCERMSLRGIARVLKINRKTVESYFLRQAHRAEIENMKNLQNKGIITSYIQFDVLETFEHTKEKPLGIYLAIRPKTGEIISAKVHRISIRSLNIAWSILTPWNSKTNQMQALTEMLIESRKAFNPHGVVLGCDGNQEQLKHAKKICPESKVIILPKNKKIDLTIRKLRNDISRLSRKSLCSTKKSGRLQNHLDLYINYNNRTRL